MRQIEWNFIEATKLKILVKGFESWNWKTSTQHRNEYYVCVQIWKFSARKMYTHEANLYLNRHMYVTWWA